MQIIFLSPLKTIILCFVMWFIIEVTIGFICTKIPEKYFSINKFYFKTYHWEKKGRIYDDIFKVKKWKKHLIDGAALFKNGYRKKHITDMSTENLEKFIIESCRAELVHVLCILPFFVFGFFTAFPIVLYMLIYALIINVPCILAQRYNRPRIYKILRRKSVMK